MKTTPNSISFSIACNREPWLEMGIAFVGLPCVAGYGLFSASYASVSLWAYWILIPILLAFVLVMGFFLLVGIGMLLYCVGQVEITKDEVRMKIGPVTVRKFPTTDITTVGYTEQGFGKQFVSYTPLMVLSAKPIEEIIQAGQRKLSRDRSMARELRKCGWDFADSKTKIHAYFFNKAPLYMLGVYKGCVIGYTEQRAESLRQFFAGAQFVV